MKKLTLKAAFLALCWFTSFVASANCFEFYRRAANSEWWFHFNAIFGRSAYGQRAVIPMGPSGRTGMLRVIEDADQESPNPTPVDELGLDRLGETVDEGHEIGTTEGVYLRRFHQDLGGSKFISFASLKATLHLLNHNESLCEDGRTLTYHQWIAEFLMKRVHIVKLGEMTSFPPGHGSSDLSLPVRPNTPEWAGEVYREKEQLRRLSEREADSGE